MKAQKLKILITLLGKIIVPVPPDPPEYDKMMTMWLQPEDITTKEKIDTIVSFSVAHHITDLFASFVDWNASPKTTLGSSTLGRQTSYEADGKLPFTYLLEQATANNIKVHAWAVIHFFYHWGGGSAVLLSPLTDNSTNHNTTNGGSCLNFATKATRDTVTDFLADMATLNPGIVSINLDYIRTDATVSGITLANITSFVSELKEKVSIPISICSLASKYAISSFMQDAVAWVQDGYADMITAMGYEYPYSLKWDYFSTYDWESNPTKKLVWGMGAQSTMQRPSDFGFQIKKYGDKNFKDFATFSWADDLKDDSGYQSPLDSFANDTLDPTMDAVTKVTVTGNTSIALTIGGVVYTTTNASVSAYTDQGTLKAAIESVQGARPFIYYMRKVSGYIAVMIGEYEP